MGLQRMRGRVFGGVGAKVMTAMCLLARLDAMMLQAEPEPARWPTICHAAILAYVEDAEQAGRFSPCPRSVSAFSLDR